MGFEPENSHVLTGGMPGKHDLQGIGAGFIPEVLDTTVYDEVLTISDEEAYRYGRLLGTREGILTGITSGAAVSAAVRLASEERNKGKNIVCLLPDTGLRYLSTRLYGEE